MMEELASGKMPGMPGRLQMPGTAAAAGGARKNAKNNKKKKARPATRRSVWRRRRQAAKAQQARAGAAFGQQAQNQEMDLSSMNLPKGFEKFLQ